MVDWAKIRTEYITNSSASYRQLAKKYGVNVTNIAKKAKTEGWVEARKQHETKTHTKTLEKISSQEAARAARIHSVADKLLDRISEMIDGGGMDPKDIRALTAALRDLREIQGVRTTLDTAEQEARIANLQRAAQRDEVDRSVVVTFEGLGGEEVRDLSG
jgi:hypothetical protein